MFGVAWTMLILYGFAVKDYRRKKEKELTGMAWKDMNTAPKDGTSILVKTKYHGFRVASWVTDYPYSEGVWSYGEYPTDYICGQLTCEPTGWKELTE